MSCVLIVSTSGRCLIMKWGGSDDPYMVPVQHQTRKTLVVSSNIQCSDGDDGGGGWQRQLILCSRRRAITSVWAFDERETFPWGRRIPGFLSCWRSHHDATPGPVMVSGKRRAYRHYTSSSTYSTFVRKPSDPNARGYLDCSVHITSPRYCTSRESSNVLY